MTERYNHATQAPHRAIEAAFRLLEFVYTHPVHRPIVRRVLAEWACYVAVLAPHASRHFARAVMAHFNDTQN